MNAIDIEDVKEELKIPDEIKIFDTTLRDGEQAEPFTNHGLGGSLKSLGHATCSLRTPST